MKKENEVLMDEYINKIENYLENSFTIKNSCIQKDIVDAMKYSLSAGGKRIRPILVLEFYKMCGGKEDILPIACSVEMIHTFSLIHDDLPCMDDDDYRRGKLSCHKKYGEALALLAGDNLATLPYEIISDAAFNGIISFETATKVIKELTSSVGYNGMIGGQVIDLISEDKFIDAKTLTNLDLLKTGALIKTSCVIGCILANASKDKINKAIKFAENLGIAFQIIDDILDVTGSFELLGKPINSDNECKKSTYVSIFGLEEAKKKANELTQNAMSFLTGFDDNQFITDLTMMLLEREK